MNQLRRRLFDEWMKNLRNWKMNRLPGRYHQEFVVSAVVIDALCTSISTNTRVRRRLVVADSARPLFWLCYRYCCAVGSTPLPCALFKFPQTAYKYVAESCLLLSRICLASPTVTFYVCCSLAQRGETGFFFTLGNSVLLTPLQIYVCTYTCDNFWDAQVLLHCCSITPLPGAYWWCSLAHLLTCALPSVACCST